MIVERDLPEEMTVARIRAMFADRDPCFELHRAELLTSFIARDARRTVCVFSAPDAEAVRRANAQARQPYVRAWTATMHEP